MNSSKKISFFKAPITRTKPYKSIPISDVYVLLTGGWLIKNTSRLRQIENKEQNRKFKKSNFPFVTFSGRFSHRSEKGLIQHSGLLTIDFDHLEDVEKVKMQLLKDPYLETQLLFTSPNGKGLKWIVPINTNGKFSHENYFEAISNYVKSTYHIEVDKSGRDVCRVCFVCFDPDAYMHPKYGKMDKLFPPEIYLVDRKKFQPGRWLNKSVERKVTGPVFFYNSMTKIQYEVEVVLRRIENFQLDLTMNYEDWLRLGFAFAAEFGEAGRNYFHRTSRFYPDYNPAGTDKQFDKCLQTKKSGVTIRSFFAAAKDAGINIRI